MIIDVDIPPTFEIPLYLPQIQQYFSLKKLQLKNMLWKY
jgi:hypothetical protein